VVCTWTQGQCVGSVDTPNNRPMVIEEVACNSANQAHVALFSLTTGSPFSLFVPFQPGGRIGGNNWVVLDRQVRIYAPQGHIQVAIFSDVGGIVDGSSGFDLCFVMGHLV
jgi:hypothetical protein